jgi:beta-glucanase (GH16 family)
VIIHYVFTFIEDYEDNDFDIDGESISYEKNKDKFDELKNNFDKIFSQEYYQYYNIQSKLDSICNM